MGLVAAKCPGNTTTFCDGGNSRQCHLKRQQSKVSRKGTVEGVAVVDILLDMGSAKTLAKRDLVPKEKLSRSER